MKRLFLFVCGIIHMSFACWMVIFNLPLRFLDDYYLSMIILFMIFTGVVYVREGLKNNFPSKLLHISFWHTLSIVLYLYFTELVPFQGGDDIVLIVYIPLLLIMYAAFSIYFVLMLVKMHRHNKA